MSITKLFSWSSIKFLISSLLLLFCCFLLFASFFGNNLPSIQNSALKQEVMLGLDLRGGVQLLLEVDFDKCLADKLNLLCQDIKKVFNKEGIDFLDIYKEGNFFALFFRKN